MNNNNAERSLFSRLSSACAAISFAIRTLYVWEIAGIILGIIGLLKQEEQKHFSIIGIIVCLLRLIVTLSL